VKRPLILRMAPARLKTALYYRIYRSRREGYENLFTDAALAFAPQFKMQLASKDDAHGEIAFTGFYELALSRRIAADARRGGMLVDVGANYGYFTLLWLAGAKPNRAMVFEASPQNYSTLRENITRNHCGGRVKVHEVAVGRECGSARFLLGEHGQTGWGGLSVAKRASEIVVPVTTLDAALGDDAIVDVLKIDVEGADTWVLQGAKNLLRKRRVRQIYFEQNLARMKALGVAEDEVADFLRTVGYEARILAGEGTEIIEWEARPAI
jgi:FkbM family methyltransferase